MGTVVRGALLPLFPSRINPFLSNTGDLDAGTLTAFLLYTIYIAAALGGLSGLYGNLMNAVGASERMFELLDMEPDINTGRKKEEGDI